MAHLSLTLVFMTVVTGFAGHSKHTPSPQAVAEAWGDVIDVRAYMNDDPDDPYRNSGTVTPDRRENRSRGEDWPIFRTEHDLALIRGIGDFFAKRSPGGISPLNTLADYTFGRGFEASAQATEGLAGVGEEFLAAVNAVISEAVEDFGAVRCREWDNRSRRHGESLLCIEPAPGGRSRVRFAEPAQLTEPTATRGIEDWLIDSGKVDCSSFLPSWSFGVLTREQRFDVPYGYHFCWTPDGRDWDFVEESRVVHVKRNVDEAVKRGVSDFFAAWEFLGHSEKLLRNTAIGSALQAAIAWIEEFVGGTSKDSVERQVSGNATGVTRIPSTGGFGASDRQIYNRRMSPGTVLKVSAGKQHKPGPMGADRAPNFIEVIQACLRYLGRRWSLTEGMISGDDSNNNYASSLTAEAPFVKAREADQGFYVGHYRDFLWKRLRMAWEAGRFRRFVRTFEELQAAIFVKVDPPRVATRDELKAAQADEILVRMGAKSRKRVAIDNGLDYEAEVADGAAPQLPAPMFGAAGAPGAPDQPSNPSPPQAQPAARPASQQPAENPTGNPTEKAALESVDDALQKLVRKFGAQA